MNEKMENTTIENKESFKVTDLSSANWVFKKLKRISNKIDELEDFAEKEIEKINTFTDKECDKLVQDEVYFKTLLYDYVSGETEKDKNFKLKTPEGTASFGKEQVKMKFDDETVLTYIKNNNLDNFISIKTTESVKKKEFKEYLEILEDGQVVTKDGEILDFIEVDKSRNLNIKLK